MTATAAPRSVRRYDDLLDAIARLDMAELHVLITRRSAPHCEVHRAIEQTERTYDEVRRAYEAYIPHIPSSRRRRRDLNAVLLVLAQPPLISIKEATG